MMTKEKFGDIIGCVVSWYDEIGSTNDLAHSGIVAGDKNGSVYVTDSQTKGRGQRQNMWESEPYMNLTFSLIIYPDFLGVGEQFLISKAVSVAVADFLDESGFCAEIKWPNDIYVRDKKIAGILIEHNILGEKIAATVIGIGLNVNQKKFGSDAPNPTSMAILSGRVFDREKSLKRLLQLFENRYRLLAVRNFEMLEKDYSDKLYRRNAFYWYKSKGKNFRAKIVGIANTGELLLEKENGEKRKFAFKEIEFVI